MRKLISFFIILVMVLCPITIHSADNAVVIDSAEVNGLGICEVIGHIDGAPEGTQIAILVTLSGTDIQSPEDLTIDNLIWIDQLTLGNNGTFLTEFLVGRRYANQKIDIRIGESFAGTTVTQTVTVPKLEPNAYSVGSNSILYGADIYDAKSSHLTVENVTDSIVSGGNIIYYKLGDNWYNLLEPDATSSAYLVPENAVDTEIVNAMPLRYYYSILFKTEFAVY